MLHRLLHLSVCSSSRLLICCVYKEKKTVTNLLSVCQLCMAASRRLELTQLEQQIAEAERIIASRRTELQQLQHSADTVAGYATAFLISVVISHHCECLRLILLLCVFFRELLNVQIPERPAEVCFFFCVRSYFLFFVVLVDVCLNQPSCCAMCRLRRCSAKAMR